MSLKETIKEMWTFGYKEVGPMTISQLSYDSVHSYEIRKAM